MKKILYVEDNEMNRDMLGRRLTRREFDVIFAFDGQEGLDKMKSESPDLVLMDMGLPVLDGWDGTFIGRPMPQTDYWFRVFLEDGREFKGHFSLVRGFD